MPEIKSALETFAESVAQDASPQLPEAEKGFDFIAIITMIMSVIQSIVQACPKPPAQIAADLKRPNRRQLAAVLKQTKETCDCVNMPRMTGRLYRSLVAKSSALPDADALAIIQEASDDANLLV